MYDDVRFQNFFKRGAERHNQFMRQVGNEPDGIGQDDFATSGQPNAAHGRVECGKQQIFGKNAGGRQAVEQSGLAGIGVTDQSNDGIRNAFACRALKFAGLFDFFQFFPDTDDFIVNDAAVKFNLSFAGAAEKTGAAALPFQMCPAANQPAALIG